MYIKFFKRLLDIIVSFIGLVVFVPVFVIIAPLIWLEDKGSIFYNAKRIGKNGKLFIMYKFRTMKENAPDIRLKDGSTYNADDDPRVTKIGKLLRKTSLDEIPQLLNVFKGDMSLVGPRPDPPDWLDRYPEEIIDFLKVKPGITGYNQAYFRNETDGNAKMKYDYYYYLNCSFFMDCKIFFKTILTVLKRDNTYKPADSKKIVHEIGSEFDFDSNILITSKNLKNNTITKNIYYCQSGRDALKAIALRHKDIANKVLMPALCCESMVTPFLNYNYSIEYYKLNDDYSIDIDDLVEKISDNSILLIMNYFGNKCIDNNHLFRIKNNYSNLTIIEDKTHDFLVNTDDYLRDYIVISIRKWFSIPDGGILIANNNMKLYINNKDFFSTRIKAAKLKSKYLVDKDPKEKERFLELFKKCNELLDNDNLPHKMSKKSLKIYSKINMEKLINKRINNISYLYANLKKHSKIKIINTKMDCYLYFPIIVKNRDIVQKKMSEKGIYCPVIWPIPKKAIGMCNVSDDASNNMIAIPCDHRYSTDDMKYIVEQLNKILK